MAANILTLHIYVAEIFVIKLFTIVFSAYLSTKYYPIIAEKLFFRLGIFPWNITCVHIMKRRTLSELKIR